MMDGEHKRYMQTGEYQAYVDRAAVAQTAAELAALRSELQAGWPGDVRAQLLGEMLLEQEQSLDWPDGTRAQTSVVWHDDPTLTQPRRVWSTGLPPDSIDAPPPLSL
jgi:hypothetical protein